LSSTRKQINFDLVFTGNEVVYDKQL